MYIYMSLFSYIFFYYVHTSMLAGFSQIPGWGSICLGRFPISMAGELRLVVRHLLSIVLPNCKCIVCVIIGFSQSSYFYWNSRCCKSNPEIHGQNESLALILEAFRVFFIQIGVESSFDRLHSYCHRRWEFMPGWNFQNQKCEASGLQTQPSAALPRSGGGPFDDPLTGGKKTQAGDIGNSTVVVLK